MLCRMWPMIPIYTAGRPPLRQLELTSELDRVRLGLLTHLVEGPKQEPEGQDHEHEEPQDDGGLEMLGQSERTDRVDGPHSQQGPKTDEQRHTLAS